MASLLFIDPIDDRDDLSAMTSAALNAPIAPLSAESVAPWPWKSINNYYIDAMYLPDQTRAHRIYDSKINLNSSAT